MNQPAGIPQDNNVAELPRPARRRRNPAQRKLELVALSIDVLAAKGYAGFTIAELAKAADVSTALVLFHFKSKEQLLVEVLKALAVDYLGALHASQIDSDASAAERLWSLVEAEFAESFLTPRYLAAWKAFWSESNGRKPYLEYFGAQNAHFLGLMEDLCRIIIHEGGYEPHEPKTVARLIDCAIGGLWIDLTNTATPISVEEARKAARAHLALLFPRHFTPNGPVRDR